jgi:hypothetical protein
MRLLWPIPHPSTRVGSSGGPALSRRSGPLGCTRSFDPTLVNSADLLRNRHAAGGGLRGDACRTGTRARCGGSRHRRSGRRRGATRRDGSPRGFAEATGGKLARERRRRWRIGRDGLGTGRGRFRGRGGGGDGTTKAEVEYFRARRGDDEEAARDDAGDDVEHAWVRRIAKRRGRRAIDGRSHRRRTNRGAASEPRLLVGRRHRRRSPAVLAVRWPGRRQEQGGRGAKVLPNCLRQAVRWFGQSLCPRCHQARGGDCTRRRVDRWDDRIRRRSSRAFAHARHAFSATPRFGPKRSAGCSGFVGTETSRACGGVKGRTLYTIHSR